MVMALSCFLPSENPLHARLAVVGTLGLLGAYWLYPPLHGDPS